MAFHPSGARLPADGLPADAWIPFLGTRAGMVSTRDDVRPFTVEEQRRILRVGACLTCHPAESAVMRDSVRDFDAVVARRSRTVRGAGVGLSDLFRLEFPETFFQWSARLEGGNRCFAGYEGTRV